MAISDPPKKPDTARPLNFKPSTLPGFRAPQPRRFAIAISPTNFLRSKYFDDLSLKESVDIVSDQTKHDKISTLRAVLKSNKNADEVALTDLKSMSIFRNVLRILKENAATISSLRAMFAARIEEYDTLVNDLTRQLNAAEEEKKALNQLLRLAVKQKLTVTESLEKMKLK